MSIKFLDQFVYLSSNISSTESVIDIRLANARNIIDKLSILWKSDFFDHIKREFFQAASVAILLYGCTTWTSTKRMEKKQAGNYSKMLRAILNKFWKQYPTKQQLYGHMSPISQAIQVRRKRHPRHCWQSKEEIISDVLWDTGSVSLKSVPVCGQKKKSGHSGPSVEYSLAEKQKITQRGMVKRKRSYGST